MKYFKIYFLECVLIFVGLIHQLLQKIINIEIQFWDNYGDDLIAVPFVSSIVLIFENRFIYRRDDRVHNIYQLLFIFIVVSVFFEFILPDKGGNYIADYWDILCYFIGLIMYYIIKRGIKLINRSLTVFNL